MVPTRQPQEKAYRKYAWIILFLLSALLVVNIVLVFGLVDFASEFQKETGVTWQEFSAAYPGVADTYMLSQRLLAVGFAGVGLLALFVTYFGVRRGQRWAWLAMWVFAGMLALAAILFSPSNRLDISGFYAVFSVVTVMALLLPIRKFFPVRAAKGRGDTA